ncbi:restriction endonuclease subunit S [Acinetobacter towneri]|uniref:restriction endonuclease subunit S n=1 Tax=Acinetobacter towneri TaxID=202956 RepID=UPI001444347D|nr:restriction endonuclease subunit S [Acinetobacter towneri]
MATPKLRFKEFDGDWINTKVKELGEFSSGGTPSKDIHDYWNGNIPWISSSDLNEESIFDIRINRFISEDAIKNSATKKIPKNSILLVSRVGVGKVALTNQELCTSQDFTALTPKKDYALFIAYLMKNITPRLLDLNQGTSIKGFVREDLISLPISLPSKAEQTKIASLISNVDEKISQLTQKHELLSQYKQGMMQKLFSQQLRFKADDGSEFGEWGKAKVGNITETIFGYPFDSKEMVEDNNGIPLMRGINIGECHIRHSFELDRFFLKDTSKLEKYFVRVNDIVLSMDGSKVGRNSAFVTEKDAGSLLVQRVCILREKENTNIQYVYQWIISKEFHRYVDQVKTSSGIPHISGKQIQDYEISYPCLEEQTKIANFLSAIDQKIEVVAQQIEQAKTWKKGLLQQMFV